MTRRAVVLVDGEHHPDAVRAALAELGEHGTRPVLVVYVGGSEKVAARGAAPDLGDVEVVWPEHPTRTLGDLVARVRPDVVVDLTADPVVDDRRRLALVAVVLAEDVAYEAPGVRYEPPALPDASARPAVAIAATAKRAGKTALSGAFARHAVAVGRSPVVVAMGRGGPAHPLVIPAGTVLSIARLREIAQTGDHAASDVYEDAVTSGVTTVGCRRVGEGPAGAIGHGNVAAGLRLAATIAGDLTVLEGSGAALPPCRADAMSLAVPATADPAGLLAMLPLRFLLADVIVLTQADPRVVAADDVAAIRAAIERIVGDLPGRARDRCPSLGIVTTRFVPTPLEDVAGARVLVATTAPPHVEAALRSDLTATGCEIVSVTHALSDRVRLRADLAAAPTYDVLLTELKAAAIDVAAEVASDRGARTVIYDNRPVLTGPDGDGDIRSTFDDLLALADEVHARRAGGSGATRLEVVR